MLPIKPACARDLLKSGQAAGISWNAAADWGVVTTATPASPTLLRATSTLDHVISLFARTAGHWASPDAVARRLDADGAFTAARSALTAVQIVAEQHAPLITRLAQTSTLYAPACKVTPPWSALLTGSPVDGCRSPPSKPATSSRSISSCLTDCRRAPGVHRAHPPRASHYVRIGSAPPAVQPGNVAHRRCQPNQRDFRGHPRAGIYPGRASLAAYV